MQVRRGAKGAGRVCLWLRARRLVQRGEQAGVSQGLEVGGVERNQAAANLKRRSCADRVGWAEAS